MHPFAVQITLPFRVQICMLLWCKYACIHGDCSIGRGKNSAKRKVGTHSIVLTKVSRLPSYQYFMPPL